jgi:4-alpha-glucanotransferase
MKRSSGILLHIVSLPGKFGIGSFGKEAYNFIDFLEKAGQKLWQICPLSPTGYGNSPYSSFSAFAGNPLLIDIEKFVHEIAEEISFNVDKVEYDKVEQFKFKVLRDTFKSFVPGNTYSEFIKEESFWLDDFALFMALKKHFNLVAWNNWDDDIKSRKPEAISYYKEKLKNEIDFQKYLQFNFFRQWEKLHIYAKSKNVQIVGDMPIYVAGDSSDAWSNPKLFALNEDMNPTFVTGVPPDGFSPTGQLWGNPVYDWDYCKETEFDWWQKRFSSAFKLYDILRIDHFIGFENYWAVPFGEKTAENGSWNKAKGRELFEKLIQNIADLPIIAEDLGLLTEDVKKLRDDFGFPGMKVLQFAFYDGPEADFLPHNFTNNCVVYTGTHDNEITKDWYKNLPAKPKKFLHEYLQFEASEISSALIKAAWNSIADIAVAPMQDFLNLGNEARFNSPGTTEGNWQWRVRKNSLTEKLAENICNLTRETGR